MSHNCLSWSQALNVVSEAPGASPGTQGVSHATGRRSTCQARNAPFPHAVRRGNVVARQGDVPTAQGDHRCSARLNGGRGKRMQRVRRTMLGLVMISTVVSAAALLGCSEAIQPAINVDLNNQSFTFANGVIFHPALANMPTTLAFSNNSTNFALSSATGTAVGTNSVNPCVLSVTFSTYASGTGPHANDTIMLTPCDFDRSNKTLIIGNGTITEISAPAVPLGS